MKKAVGFNIKRNKKLLVSDIIKFFEIRGYTLVGSSSKHLLFKRGRIGGNLFSLNPMSWKTRVEIEIVQRELMDYNVYANYRFSILGPTISYKERDFYNEEINAFSNAIQNFDVNNGKVEQLAIGAYKSNLKHMVGSAVVGILIAVGIIFSVNFFTEGRLTILAASIITAFSILSCYAISRRF